MLDHAAAVKCAAELTRTGRAMNYSEEQKVKATAAIFNELHEWAKDSLPMGASAADTEVVIRKGLKAVRNKMQGQAEQTEEKYGVPILLILGLIPSIFNLIKMLVAWWNGGDE